MNNRVIRIKELTATVGLSRSTIYARINEGTFPKPFPIGGRLVGWLESDIQLWIKEQAKQRITNENEQGAA